MFATPTRTERVSPAGNMKKRYLKLVRQALKSLRHPRLRHHPWWQVLMRRIGDRALWVPCRDTVATGLTVGLFFSMMLMPFQMIPAAIMSVWLRANVPFALLGCWVSNPLTTPALLYIQFRLGDWMRETLSVPMPGFLSKVQFDVAGVGQLNAASFILGMFTSGLLLACCAYPLVHLFSAVMPHHLPVRRQRAKSAGPKKPAVCEDSGVSQ
jgi:uncharacterized protein (DUF2062 family)